MRNERTLRRTALSLSSTIKAMAIVSVRHILTLCKCGWVTHPALSVAQLVSNVMVRAYVAVYCRTRDRLLMLLSFA